MTRWPIVSLFFVVMLTFASSAAVTPRGTVASPEFAEDGYLTTLLLGSDSAFDRTGIRTDTMIVASVNLKTGQTALFGVPRNLVNVPLPEPYAALFSCGCWESLLNELFQFAESNPELFPGDSRGGEVLKATIGNLLGIDIDYFVKVNMAGFVEVVDTLGGVTIYNPDEMTIYISSPYEGDAWFEYLIPAGTQHLDGLTALAWVRSREGESDYDRMARQRCLVGAMGQQVDVSELLLNYGDLVDTLINKVETDMPIEAIPDMLAVAENINFDEVITVGFDSPDYMLEYVDEGYPVPDPWMFQVQVEAAQALSPEEADARFGSVPTSCGTYQGN